MKRLYIALTVMTMSFVLVSCTQLLGPGTTPETVRQAIETAAAKFAEAFNQGDVVAIVDFYMEDAQLLPPNSSMVSGQEDIQKFWKGFVETTAWRDLILEPLKIDYDGRLAYEVGAYTLRFQPKGSTQTVTDTGKYVVVWKSQADRSWKITADIWNSSMPLSTP